MALTKTNAAITVQDGAGAAVNVADAGVGYFTEGALVTFALQSTTGVARWDLIFLCPAYPSLHQRQISWQQGQANKLQVQMPAAMAASANPYNGIQIASVVSDGVSSVAQAVMFMQTIGGAAPQMVRYARVASAASLQSYAAAGGVLTASATGAQTAVDGVTVAAGDRVLLLNGATAADNGLYVVTTVGATGVKWKWTRAPEWPTGATIKSGSVIEIGPEGTAYANAAFKVTAAGDPVVDTTDPAMGLMQLVSNTVRYARAVTIAALDSYAAAGGVLTASATGAQTAVDGVTLNKGDRVLLTMGAAAADNGLYVVTTKGATGVKWVWTRAPEWATGSTINSGSIVEVGPEGAALANTTWKVTAASNPIVDTTDPALYPRTQLFTATLSSGSATVANMFVLATTSAVAWVDITAAHFVKAALTAGVPGTGAIALSGGNSSDTIQGAVINF